MSDVQGYDELRRRIAAISGDALGRDVMGLLAAAAIAEQKTLLYRNVERRTGNSGRNVVMGRVTAESAETIARGTALFIDQGTKPHEIYPRNKQALFFSAGGGGVRLTGSVRSAFRGSGGRAKAAAKGISLVFAKHVHHPGTAARPFMVEGATEAIKKAGLLDRLVARWNKAA